MLETVNCDRKCDLAVIVNRTGLKSLVMGRNIWLQGGEGNIWNVRRGWEKLLHEKLYRFQYHATARWTRHVERTRHGDCLQNISPKMKAFAFMTQKQRRVDIRRHLTTYLGFRTDRSSLGNGKIQGVL
jgi:hypothetical protein